MCAVVDFSDSPPPYVACAPGSDVPLPIPIGFRCTSQGASGVAFLFFFVFFFEVIEDAFVFLFPVRFPGRSAASM